MRLLEHSPKVEDRFLRDFTSRKSKKASTLQDLHANFTLYITHSDVMKPPVEGLGGSFGFSIDTGDWNKDGHKDLAISAPWDKNGKVIIKWGPLPLTYLNSNMLSVRTTTITYSYSAKLFGYVVKNACDLNGDGIDDLIITSPDKDGMVFYLFGAKTMSAIPSFDFMNITKVKGGIIYGIAGSFQELGWSVASCKDLDQDGRFDFIVSAPSVTSRATTGTVYIATQVYNYSVYTNVISLPNITSETRSNFGFALEVVENTPNTGEFSIVSSAFKESDDDGAVYLVPIKNISTTINLYSQDVWHIKAPYGSYMQLGYSLSVYRNKIALGATGYNYDDGAVFIINTDDYGKNFTSGEIINYTGIPNAAGRFGNSIILNEYGILIGIPYLDFESGGLAWFFKEESTNILDLRGDNGFLISGSKLGRSHFGLSMLTVSGLSMDNWPVLFASAPSLYNWDGALGLIPPSCCYKELTRICLPRLDATFIAPNGTEITLQCPTTTLTPSASETQTYSASENHTLTQTHSSSNSLTISNTKNSPSHTSTLSISGSKTITESYTKNISHSLSLTQTTSTTLSPTKNSPTDSKSITESHSENTTDSLSLTQTASATSSPTKNSPSYTPTPSSTNSQTTTESYTRNLTHSLSLTQTASNTLSPTKNSPSYTLTYSSTTSQTTSESYTKNLTHSLSLSQTVSATLSPTFNDSITVSDTKSISNSLSKSATVSSTSSLTGTSLSYSAIRSANYAKTATESFTKSANLSTSVTSTNLPTLSATATTLSAINTHTPTNSESLKASTTKTATPTFNITKIKTSISSLHTSSDSPTKSLITESSNHNTPVLSVSITTSKTNYAHVRNLGITPTTSDDNPGKHYINPELTANSWSTSGIIGIVVGLVVGTIVIAVGIAGITYFCCCRRRSSVANSVHIGDLFPDNKDLRSSHSSLLPSSSGRTPLFGERKPSSTFRSTPGTIFDSSIVTNPLDLLPASFSPPPRDTEPIPDLDEEMLPLSGSEKEKTTHTSHKKKKKAKESDQSHESGKKKSKAKKGSKHKALSGEIVDVDNSKEDTNGNHQPTSQSQSEVVTNPLSTSHDRKRLSKSKSKHKMEVVEAGNSNADVQGNGQASSSSPSTSNDRSHLLGSSQGSVDSATMLDFAEPASVPDCLQDPRMRHSKKKRKDSSKHDDKRHGSVHSSDSATMLDIRPPSALSTRTLPEPDEQPSPNEPISPLELPSPQHASPSTNPLKPPPHLQSNPLATLNAAAHSQHGSISSTILPSPTDSVPQMSSSQQEPTGDCTILDDIIGNQIQGRDSTPDRFYRPASVLSTRTFATIQPPHSPSELGSPTSQLSSSAQPESQETLPPLQHNTWTADDDDIAAPPTHSNAPPPVPKTRLSLLAHSKESTNRPPEPSRPRSANPPAHPTSHRRYSDSVIRTSSNQPPRYISSTLDQRPQSADPLRKEGRWREKGQTIDSSPFKAPQPPSKQPPTAYTLSERESLKKKELERLQAIHSSPSQATQPPSTQPPTAYPLSERESLSRQSPRRSARMQMFIVDADVAPTTSQSDTASSSFVTAPQPEAMQEQTPVSHDQVANPLLEQAQPFSSPSDALQTTANTVHNSSPPQQISEHHALPQPLPSASEPPPAQPIAPSSTPSSLTEQTPSISSSANINPQPSPAMLPPALPTHSSLEDLLQALSAIDDAKPDDLSKPSEPLPGSIDEQSS